MKYLIHMWKDMGQNLTREILTKYFIHEMEDINMKINFKYEINFYFRYDSEIFSHMKHYL